MSSVVNYRALVIANALKDVGTTGGSASGDDKYINFYNNLTGTTFDVDTTPWCAIFVTYMLRTTGIPTSVCPNFAGCTTVRDNFLKPNNIWKARGKYTPQMGDLILFNWNKQDTGKAQHVGLVEKVEGDKVYTVEGNSKGGFSQCGVRHKSYALTSGYIQGYGALKYETITGLETVSTATTSANTYAISSATKKVYVKKYQTWLNEKVDAKLVVDGSYGPLTKKAAIKALQTTLNTQNNAGLEIDGSFGPLTKAALVNIRKGSKGDLVYIAQGLLYSRGYNPNGFDGSFGSGMYACVGAYQSAKGLASDKIIGKLTWTKLING